VPFHAILGLSIYSQSTIIAEAHYRALQLPWSNLASDQKVGGGLLWSSGELVGLIMLTAITFQWIRDSEREAAREDRRLDRLEALEALQAASRAGSTASDDGPAAGDSMRS
jgi:putative copper resistance protein D